MVSPSRFSVEKKKKKKIMAFAKLFALHTDAKTPETYKQTNSNKKGNS